MATNFYPTVPQRGPYIDPTSAPSDADYGTQSQTLIIRSLSGGCVYYFYRCTQGKSIREVGEVPWNMHWVPDPRTTPTVS